MTRAIPVHLLIALAILVLSGVAYGLWYAFVQSESAKVVTLAGQVATQSDDAKRATAAKAALASLASDEAYMRSYFVATNDIVVFLEKLQKTGKGFDAVVEVASVAADTKTSDRPHITVALKITGTFDAVMRTLGAIEYGPYDSTATGVTLDRPAVTAGKPVWTATATFLIGTDTSNASSTPTT